MKLNTLIKESFEQIHKTNLLKEEKSVIENILKQIDENENLSEEELNELLGGLKKVGQMFGQKAQAAGEKVKQKVQGVGQQIKQKAQDAGQQIKQTYQAGEKEAKLAKAKEQIATIANQISNIDRQAAVQKQSLQQQYAQLSGGKPFSGAVHNPVLAEE